MKRNLVAMRNNDAYQKALSGEKKTGAFVFEAPVHILKFGRYNFQWRNNKSRQDYYKEKFLDREVELRRRFGFGADAEADPTNWRNKKKIGKDGKEIPVYGGGGEMPRLKKEPTTYNEPIGGANADFYRNVNNPENITFQQIISKNNIKGYQFFYVVEDPDTHEGPLEPMDYSDYIFLSKAFSSVKVKEAGDDLLDEERDFIKELDALKSEYFYQSYNWDKILYFVFSIVKKDPATGKRVYEPCVWINDKIIKNTYGFIPDDDLKNLIDKNVNVSKNNMADYQKTPAAWANDALAESSKSKSAFVKSLCENIMNTIKSHLNEGYAEDLDDNCEILKEKAFELLDEYGGQLVISDWNYTVRGTQIDVIELGADDGDIHYWAGDPETDKYAEEIILNVQEETQLLETILHEF